MDGSNLVRYGNPTSTYSAGGLPRPDDTKVARSDRTQQELQASNNALVALRARQVRGIPIERAHSLLNRSQDDYRSDCKKRTAPLALFGLLAATGGLCLAGRSVGMGANFEAEGGVYVASGALGSIVSGYFVAQNIKQWVQTRSLQPHRDEIESHMQGIRNAQANHLKLEAEDFLVAQISADPVDIVREYVKDEQSNAVGLLPERCLRSGASHRSRQAWAAPLSDHVLDMPGAGGAGGGFGAS